MYRHLLVPLDGSPLAEGALPAAARIAEVAEARITLLHIVEPSPPKRVHGEPHLTDPGEADAYLAKIQDRLEARGLWVDRHVHTPGTETAHGIVEHARELGADLVVLCAHGGRGVRGLVHGRLGQQVVAEGEVPVLVVPSGRDVWECRRILVALDEDDPGPAALAPGVRLAESLGATLVLVRVVATPGTLADERRWPARLLPGGARELLAAEARGAAERLEGLRAEIEARGLRVEAVVARGDAVSGIVAAAEHYDADLVVLATRGLAGLSAVWSGSVAARLVERIDRSILLVRRSGDDG
jgi:nucleotide-binding universal stress UspA family protein